MDLPPILDMTKPGYFPRRPSFGFDCLSGEMIFSAAIQIFPDGDAIVREILSDEYNRNVQGVNRVTPLLNEVYENKPKYVQMPLEKGASPFIEDIINTNPICAAAKPSKVRMLDIFKDFGFDITMPNRVLHTPLMRSSCTRSFHFDVGFFNVFITLGRYHFLRGGGAVYP